MWIVYPRNFGNSDQIDSFDDQGMADDLARFMYYNKISTASVGGHGIGGQLALKAASRHHTRVTGYFGLDTAPVNYNNFDVFQEVKAGVEAIRGINLSKPRAAILNDINRAIPVDFAELGLEAKEPVQTEPDQVRELFLPLELQPGRYR